MSVLNPDRDVLASAEMPERRGTLLTWGLLSLLLAVFVVLKLPVLETPYFWDELGVYAPGALYMSDNGIGILPAQLDPEYSRGHPLLAYAYTAVFYRLFGDTVAVGHASAIFAAVIVLLLLFFTGKRIFGTKVALCAVVLLACQPLFFSMAGVIYPEMLLAIVFVWAFYALAAGRWMQFALAASVAVLLKETGLILPALGGLYWLREFSGKKRAGKMDVWKKLPAVLAPLIVYASFLVVQRAQHGWYFFPYHLELIQSDPGYMWGVFLKLLRELCIDQGRVVLTVPILVSLFFYRKIFATGVQRRYFVLFGLALLLTCLFAIFNFYLARYWLFLYPSYMLLGTFALFRLASLFLNRYHTWVAFGVLALAVALAIATMKGNRFRDNYDMAYRNSVQVTQECIRWLETQPAILADTPRVSAPVYQALQDPRNGYVERAIPFRTDWNAASRYFILYRIGDESLPDQLKTAQAIKRFTNQDNTILVFDTQAPAQP